MCPNLQTTGAFCSTAVRSETFSAGCTFTAGEEMDRSGESRWKLATFMAFIYQIQMNLLDGRYLKNKERQISFYINIVQNYSKQSKTSWFRLIKEYNFVWCIYVSIHRIFVFVCECGGKRGLLKMNELHLYSPLTNLQWICLFQLDVPSQTVSFSTTWGQWSISHSDSKSLLFILDH